MRSATHVPLPVVHNIPWLAVWVPGLSSAWEFMKYSWLVMRWDVVPESSRVEMKSLGSSVITAQDSLHWYSLVDGFWGVGEDKSEGVVMATATDSGF